MLCHKHLIYRQLKKNSNNNVIKTSFKKEKKITKSKRGSDDENRYVSGIAKIDFVTMATLKAIEEK